MTSQTTTSDLRVASVATKALPAPEGKLYFDAILRPHRSLSRTGFVLLMSLVSGLSFVGGVFFYTQGAWPIPGFLGLDVLLIYGAFRLNYRNGRAYETLRLDERVLEVCKVDARGRARAWRFQPYWVRVIMDDPPRHGSQLVLSSHGRRLAVGGFLTPRERLEVAEALRAALRRQANRRVAAGP